MSETEQTDQVADQMAAEAAPTKAGERAQVARTPMLGPSPLDEETFSCPECGRRFLWTADIVAQTVQCSCGHAFSAPAECDERQYDLAPEPVPPQPAPTPPAASHASLKPQRVLPYESAELSPQIEDYFPDRVKDLYLPIVLLSVGVLVEFAAAWWSASIAGDGPRKALARVGTDLVFSTGAMLLAIWIAAELRGIGFGAFWSAVLKLAAVAVAPSAAMILLYLLLHRWPLPAAFVALIAAFCLYFALISVLFKLDAADTLYCVLVMFLVKVAVVLAAVWLGLAGLL